MMCPTSGMSMPMGLCSSTPSRHQPSTALSTTTTISAPQKTRLAKSGAQISVLKQVGAPWGCQGWFLPALLHGLTNGPSAEPGLLRWVLATGWSKEKGRVLGGMCSLEVSRECLENMAWLQPGGRRVPLPLNWDCLTQPLTEAFPSCGRGWATSVHAGGPLSVPQPGSHCSTQPQLAKAY